MTVITWTALAAAAVSVLAVSGCGHPSRAGAVAVFCEPMPAAVAHRGGTERALENTLGAFRAAGDAGIRTWEIDVRFDVRGTPVVLHDATVDRVSPDSGPIAELDAGDGDIATDDGQYIPTLGEVYELAEQYRADVLTELKVRPTDRQWATVAALIDATIGVRSVTVMSFDRTVVLAAAERIPGAERALIHDAGYLSPEQIQRYGGAYNKQYSAISRSRAEEWHAAGIRLYAWTVDRATDWETLSAWPVDGFVTNRPIEYQQWAAGRCGTGDPARRPIAPDTAGV